MRKFKDNLTKRIFDGEVIRGYPLDLIRKAVMKLTMVEAATNISELKTPPSNHLEKLKGDRLEQWSIRVNDKYRICFYWDDENNKAYEMEFVDYH